MNGWWRSSMGCGMAGFTRTKYIHIWGVLCRLQNCKQSWFFSTVCWTTILFQFCSRWAKDNFKRNIDGWTCRASQISIDFSMETLLDYQLTTATSKYSQCQPHNHNKKEPSSSSHHLVGVTIKTSFPNQNLYCWHFFTIFTFSFGFKVLGNKRAAKQGIVAQMKWPKLFLFVCVIQLRRMSQLYCLSTKKSLHIASEIINP